MSELVTSYDARLDEEARVRGWRLDRLLELGYTVPIAVSLLEAHVDWHQLQGLVDAGCPLDLAAKIAG